MITWYKAELEVSNWSYLDPDARLDQGCQSIGWMAFKSARVSSN